MTELEALRRVAEAARRIATAQIDGTLVEALRHQFAVLDDLPTEAPAEMVTLALMQARNDGTLTATAEPEQEDPRYWAHIGNITFARPPLPRVPEVVATVEPAP